MAGFIEKAQTRYLRRADAPDTKRFEFEPWEWNSPRIDEVWAMHRDRIRAGLIRDKDYIFWRYGCHPINGYRLLGVLENGDPVGFIVAGNDRPGERDRAKETPVVDLLLPEADTTRVLHELAGFWGNDVMFWQPNRVTTDTDEQKDSGTHVYHFKADSAASTEFLEDHLYYTMGDVDWW